MKVARDSKDGRWLVGYASGNYIDTWGGRLSKSIRNPERPKVKQEKLAQLVFFMRRYPDFFENHRVDLPTRICAAIQEPTDQGCNALLTNLTSANHIDLDVREKGYTSQYVGRHDIVAPTLERLCHFASTWDHQSYFSPYTSLVGPTMIGKNSTVDGTSSACLCGIHLCLRPRGSTGLPPRSQLADTMLTCPNAKNATHHYVRIITAILRVMFQFFTSYQQQETSSSSQKNARMVRLSSPLNRKLLLP